jgi:Ca2+-binding RTX toxin-like protein
VVERIGQGTDTVRATVHHGLAANVENLSCRLGQPGRRRQRRVNTITGNSGDNILNGRRRRHAGGGGRRYVLRQQPTDVITAGGQGNDLAVVLFSGYTLDAANVEAASLGLATGGVLTGSNAADTLGGNAGGDVLSGRGGNDSRVGLNGADVLFGDAGAAALAGGLGADIFALVAGDGADTIVDFAAGQGDLLAMAGFGVTTFAALQSHMSQQAADVLIDFAGQGSFLLKNTTLADITAAQVALG